MTDYKYFTEEEFMCHCGCGRNKIDYRLILLLDQVRYMYGKPMLVTSGYRCPTYNTTIGVVDSSSHVHGKAADIFCDNSTDRFKLLNLLIPQFRRVGIADDFIHVDIDSTKAMGVAWVY